MFIWHVDYKSDKGECPLYTTDCAHVTKHDCAVRRILYWITPFDLYRLEFGERVIDLLLPLQLLWVLSISPPPPPPPPPWTRFIGTDPQIRYLVNESRPKVGLVLLLYCGAQSAPTTEFTALSLSLSLPLVITSLWDIENCSRAIDSYACQNE